jgi:hypothetical protein
LKSGESRLLVNAGGIVILTIAGMMAGLAFGLIWSWTGPDDPFLQIRQVVSGGIVGTAFGLGLAILLVARARGTFRSLRQTMAFIVVAAVVIWAIVIVLRLVNSFALI